MAPLKQTRGAGTPSEAVKFLAAMPLRCPPLCAPATTRLLLHPPDAPVDTVSAFSSGAADVLSVPCGHYTACMRLQHGAWESPPARDADAADGGSPRSGGGRWLTPAEEPADAAAAAGREEGLGPFDATPASSVRCCPRPPACEC